MEQPVRAGVACTVLSKTAASARGKGGFTCAWSMSSPLTRAAHATIVGSRERSGQGGGGGGGGGDVRWAVAQGVEPDETSEAACSVVEADSERRCSWSELTAA